jgi:hypothetical protein
LWTQAVAGPGWSWIQCLGRSSLLVYWVHVVLVYCNATAFLKRTMTVPQAVLAAIAVTGLMVWLASAKQNWVVRKAERRRAETTVAGSAAFDSPQTA